LAIPVLGVKGFADPSVIFGIWWVTAGIGALIFLMAFGLMGFFQISLPQGAYMVNPQADTPSGSFLFGVMTAVLGLPCFGFVIGALLPQAVAADWSVVVALFLSLGAGRTSCSRCVRTCSNASPRPGPRATWSSR
jgi:cytochrome c biogenesis protein CcdA